ncbi:MAG: acVLRF1 family peptidyl-tRNA hydrolase [Nocardioidaceae bacterium]
MAFDDSTVSAPRLVSVTWTRLPGWCDRFDARHVDSNWQIGPDAVKVENADGTSARFDIPFAPLRETTMSGLLAHLDTPRPMGVLLVRRGGFAVARLLGTHVVDSKVGRRHVQGRTKAGGWSQQRFARRRDNQAQLAFAAAGDYAEAILAPAPHLVILGAGGDRQGLDVVLNRPRLRSLARAPRRQLTVTGDPRRQELLAAVDQLTSVSIQITDGNRRMQ